MVIHTPRQSSLKKILATVAAVVAGLTLFAGLTAMYNVAFWLSQGSPLIPHLENRWWAGYYDTNQLGRQRCLARFGKSPSGRLEMILLSASGARETFEVEQSTSSENFVYLTFTDRSSGLRIDAKQLYDGKRYYLGRLMVGRFRDFWKMNDDISIRGRFAGGSAPREFAIAPLGDEHLAAFWAKYIRPGQPVPSPNELLHAAGTAVEEHAAR